MACGEDRACRRPKGYGRQQCDEKASKAGSNVAAGGKCAGCGRFSILLAKHGCEVTHFDISQSMINKAKELAKKEEVVDRITFCEWGIREPE